MTFGVIVALPEPAVTAEYVRTAANAWGCCPDCPKAARSFNASHQPRFQKGSSAMTHVPLTFG